LFQSVRRDALYCSLRCRQKAHRARKTQLFPKVARLDERPAVQSVIKAQDATLAPRIEVQAHAVAHLDGRLGHVDSTIEEAARRGRTDAALVAIDGQCRAHQVLARGHQDASTLTDLKAERATLGSNGRPIRHLAEPTSADADSGEWAMRWLLALMVLCCDRLAVAPKAAASARNRRKSDTALPKKMDDVLQVAD
jgi:hypothetical protein